MVNETVNVTGEFEPEDEFVIADLDTLKVLADPLRLSILEYLAEPATVKEIAGKLGKPPTKLYYHFNLLEKHGLIQMVDTRIVSGIIEKHYRASAHVYRVEQSLLSPGSEGFNEGLDVMLGGILGDARNEIRESLVAGLLDPSEAAPPDRRLMLTQARLNLTSAQAREFSERLFDLVKEYDHGLDPDDDDTQAYKLLLLMHPSVRSAHHDFDDEM